MSKKIYTVDWVKLARWLLPPRLRQPRFRALVKALTTPINELHTQFTYYRLNVDYRLKITPQVCHLQRALNDRYDVTERRIYITGRVERAAVPMYKKVESKPVVFNVRAEGDGVVFYTKQETSQFSADFVINIPITVAFDLAELTAFVNIYCLAGKTFKVKIV